MAWRLHLTNQIVHRLDILPGKQPLLGAWAQPNRVFYFDLETGTELGEMTLMDVYGGDRQAERWREFVQSLVAPNRAHLPFVRKSQLTIHTTDDGQMRLYQVGDSMLYLEMDGSEVSLDVSDVNVWLAVGFDRFMGVIGALDEKKQLHLYQQNIPVGVFNLGLNVASELRPMVAVSHGGAAIYVCDGQQIVLTDSSGQVRKRLETHYFVGRMSCSPDGKLLATSDIENGVLRIYDDSLTPMRQRHAIDLLAEATQIQLIADLPPATIALSALAIDNQGVCAFAMSGVLCVTSLDRLDVLPQPQALF
jgi:hypothetical protein